MQRPIGLVLAGGLGRRMGRPKGSLELDGETLATRAARLLEPLCHGVLVSIARDMSNPAPGWPALEDRYRPGRGPLDGIARGYEETGDSDLLVLACDYPWMSGALLTGLLGQAPRESDVVLVRDADGRDQPLVALWRRSARMGVDRALQQGLHGVVLLLEQLNVTRLEAAAFPGVDAARCLRNANRPDDL